MLSASKFYAFFSREKKSFGGISFEFLYSMMETFLKFHLKNYFEELLACNLNRNYFSKLNFIFLMNLGRE